MVSVNAAPSSYSVHQTGAAGEVKQEHNQDPRDLHEETAIICLWMQPFADDFFMSNGQDFVPCEWSEHLCERNGEYMQLGSFSVSLTVKNIESSRAFYEKLGFQKVGGDIDQNWLVLKNGDTKIGLFQGMFEKNIMTFNPGWDTDRKTPEGFQDIRVLQEALMSRGLKPLTEIDKETQGPASFILEDPDGNPILFDQHVESPESSGS